MASRPDEEEGLGTIERPRGPTFAVLAFAATFKGGFPSSSLSLSLPARVSKIAERASRASSREVDGFRRWALNPSLRFTFSRRVPRNPEVGHTLG